MVWVGSETRHTAGLHPSPMPGASPCPRADQYPSFPRKHAAFCALVALMSVLPPHALQKTQLLTSAGTLFTTSKF